MVGNPLDFPKIEKFTAPLYWYHLLGVLLPAVADVCEHIESQGWEIHSLTFLGVPSASALSLPKNSGVSMIGILIRRGRKPGETKRPEPPGPPKT